MRVQSKRRKQVAQKRQRQGKDVLRRPITFSTECIYLWHWALNAPFDEYSWISPSSHEVGLFGSLPDNRQLAKPLTVNVTWDSGEWLVSEPIYHMHAAGSTISKAVASFRHIFSRYLDVLSEHEDRPMSQHLHDQLAYLREMIQEKIT
ncbi:MAG: hypothetical protein AUF65_00825 [Chloroflexi bacterium 13_1_20CM_50_12]|nr:MAG: hypothetical protein AUF65_00825 [Chloroflexi bacterium 13_1_20CM_50_12]